MTHSVYWSAFASAELGRLERAAADPARIRDATRWMDQNLRRYPLDMGESRVPAGDTGRPHHRVWFADVLAVVYWLDPQALRVEVLTVGLSRRPRG